MTDFATDWIAADTTADSATQRKLCAESRHVMVQSEFIATFVCASIQCLDEIRSTTPFVVRQVKQMCTAIGIIHQRNSDGIYRLPATSDEAAVGPSGGLKNCGA